MRMLLVAALLTVAQSAPTPKGVRLERLPSAAAQAALTADSVVVIPFGAGLQPHSDHLGLGTDMMLSEHLAHRVMVATAVAVTPSIAHTSDAAKQVTIDLARTLSRLGPRRFYVLNTAAAPARLLGEVASTLARDGILLRFSDLQNPIGVHASEPETSMMLHIDVPMVIAERAPSTASAARGKVFIDALVERIVGEIEELKRATPPDRQPPPAPPPPPPPPPAPEPLRASGCTAGDERSIADVATRFNSYWALGDVDRISELWSKEGDLAHPDGVVERGREIIRTNRREQFRRKEYRASKHSVRFGVIRCVSPDVAVVDGKWELSGVYDAEGKLLPRGDGPTTVVLKKQSDTWLFEAYRYWVTITQQQGAKPPTLLKKPGYPDR